MEETAQSSGYHNDIDEESREDYTLKQNIFRKRGRNGAEQKFDDPCACNDKYFCGKKCECVAIKEDIRTLFSLGEFIDKLIEGQKKALQTPLEQSKLYKMLDMVFDMNIKPGDCSCEQDEESIDSDNGQSVVKDEPPSCQCPDLPKKRCVLRIIRNDVYQRMKLVKKLNFLLTEKNKKIREMIKNKKKNDPRSPYVKKSVSYDETIHRLIERFHLLKEMKEKNLPKACLFDRKELLGNIGQHRILTKPLRHIYMVEELAEEVRKKIQKDSDSDECDVEDVSDEDKCRCPEIDKKIEFIKNFKTMIARLNPILKRREETLDFTKSEEKTMEQLINEKRKEEQQKLADLLHKRKADMKFVLEQHQELEDEKMLIDVVLTLRAHVKLLDDQLQSYEKNRGSNEVKAMLIDEKEELLELIDLLNKYKNKNKEALDDEKSLLEEINVRLEDYLEKQRKYFDKMEKLIPGFKIAIFDEELQKDRIVAEICRDDDEGKNFKSNEKSEPDGRERLRTLIKGLNKPHLHVVGSPLGRFEKKQQSGQKVKTSQPSVGSSKKNLINKLKKVKKKIDDKLNGEDDECQYEILEKELLKEMGDLDPPVSKPKDEDDVQPNMNYGEMVKIKLRNIAFEEGRKIISQHDPLIKRQENLVRRKRLVHELGLKCKQSGHCCTDKPGAKKLMLKAAYETKPKKDCSCTNRQKQLSTLESDFENIILQPEKHRIDFVSGPLKFVNTTAIKRIRAFIHKHAKRKNESIESETDLFSSLSKRKLVTEYDESRFSVAWKDFERSGFFSINLEAQMMTNERIIIRPQYKKRVKVLSGGRIGLDPLYAEYVCTGMLDGVVLGNERNGPIPRTILQAIKELDSGEGVVIIILNEYEERLSFLFAIERARKLGINAELVLARDDVSDHQPEKWRYGCRGHTGIIIQFKIAAGMAAKGYNLAAISRVTQGIQIATLDCYLTKYGPFIGSGIRNEKGYYIPGLQAEDVLSELLRQLMDPTGHHSIVPEPDTKMIVLISKFRMCSDDVYSIISFVTKRILETGANVGRVYHGNFSALTKQGFAITLAKDWNDELIQFLDFPTTCVHWPPHLSGSRDIVMTRTRLHREHTIGALVPEENVGIVFEIIDRTLREIAFSLDRILEYCRPIGTALLNIVWILKPNLKRLPLNRPFLFLCYVGKVLNKNIPAIGNQFQLVLVSAAQEFMKDPDFVVSWKNWCKALKKGTQCFAGYTKFRVGDGTILDYLLPVTDAICKIEDGWSPLTMLFGALEKVNHLEEERKDDLGIMILGLLFRNMYACLEEYVGHYPREAWWKEGPSPQIVLVNESCEEEICRDAIPEDLKEKIKEKEKQWLKYVSPRSSVYSIKEKRGTEPSIEARSLEGAEEESESIRSAAGVLYEQLQSNMKYSDQAAE